MEGNSDAALRGVGSAPGLTDKDGQVGCRSRGGQTYEATGVNQRKLSGPVVEEDASRAAVTRAVRSGILLSLVLAQRC